MEIGGEEASKQETLTPSSLLAFSDESLLLGILRELQTPDAVVDCATEISKLPRSCSKVKVRPASFGFHAMRHVAICSKRNKKMQMGKLRLGTL